jgi:Domain of unknown function (DUF1840)
MPITFKSKYSPDILMLESVAKELIRLMGHSGSLPGSLAAEDIPAALARLEAAIAGGATQALQADRPKAQDDDHHEPAISAAHRAGPLIKMLQIAAREAEHVIWDR